MNVIQPRNIQNALRTIDDDERRTVQSWFDRLGNWETDEQIREMTKTTKWQDTYDLDTPDDLRFFFTLDELKNEIVILDLAKPSRFKNALAASE